MRVGELSRRSGVSVPSIKYYLREGLLPAGERTGPNQASYGDEHLRRLRLIRALIDVGGLSVAATRAVLGAVDDDTMALHSVLGVAQAAVTQVGEPAEDEALAGATAVVDDLVARRGWAVHADSPGRRAAADVLATWSRLGAPTHPGPDAYAEAVEALAAQEVGGVITDDREEVVEGAVLGIVLGGALLSALRSMAQEDASARRLADPMG